MKMQFYAKDAPVISAFMSRWVIKNEFLPLLFTDEFEGFYFDCPPEELQNCFMELEKKGFTQSVKEVFQGNHFYRSDTGKCARCRRYRPEVHWNAENMPEADCCDRCQKFHVKQRGAGE